MGTAGVVALVFVILATDAVVFWGVGKLVGVLIGPLARAYPPVAPAPDAITRRYQSFGIGLCNFGRGVHVSVDESYLHLVPAGFAKFFGMRAMSIPWEKIEPRPKPRFGRALKVRVGVTDITGPAWCLSLAGRTEANGPPGNVPPGGAP